MKLTGTTNRYGSDGVYRCCRIGRKTEWDSLGASGQLQNETASTVLIAATARIGGRSPDGTDSTGFKTSIARGAGRFPVGADFSGFTTSIARAAGRSAPEIVSSESKTWGCSVK